MLFFQRKAFAIAFVHDTCYWFVYLCSHDLQLNLWLDILVRLHIAEIIHQEMHQIWNTLVIVEGPKMKFSLWFFSEQALSLIVRVIFLSASHNYHGFFPPIIFSNKDPWKVLQRAASCKLDAVIRPYRC